MVDTFAPATVLEGRGDVLPVSHGDDGAFDVRFYMREVEDEAQTRAHGRRILKAVPYCRKQAVGDARTVWDQPASDTDKMRWPQQWAAFQHGEQDVVIGAPLEAAPFLNGDMRAALKNHGFKTVEQLAAVTDGSLAQMNQPGLAPLLQNVREHARKFMADQEVGEAERRLAKELEERDAKIAAQEEQIKALAQQMERMKEHQLAGPVVTPEETAPVPAPITTEPVPVAPDTGAKALESLPIMEPLTSEGIAPEYTVKRGFHEFKVLDPAGEPVATHKTKAEAEQDAEQRNKAA